MKKKNVVKKSKASFEKFVGKLEMDKDVLTKTSGGEWPGAGHFSTISGDCFKGGTSCWDLLPF